MLWKRNIWEIGLCQKHWTLYLCIHFWKDSVIKYLISIKNCQTCHCPVVEKLSKERTWSGQDIYVTISNEIDPHRYINFGSILRNRNLNVNDYLLLKAPNTSRELYIFQGLFTVTAKIKCHMLQSHNAMNYSNFNPERYISVKWHENGFHFHMIHILRRGKEWVCFCS